MSNKRRRRWLLLSAIFVFSLIFVLGFSSYKKYNIKMMINKTTLLKQKPPAKGYLGMSLPAGFQAFSNTSPWNTIIPDNQEIDRHSDLMLKYLKFKAKQLKGDLTKWTIPIHVIDFERSPKLNVKTTDEGLYSTIDPDENGIAEGVPMPDGVWPDPEKDGHMILIDPKVGKSWEFTRARKLKDETWIATRIDVWDLDGNGFRQPFSGKYWWTSGAMAAGMPLIAGLIRPEEIEAGEIKHALLFASPINRKTTYRGGRPEVCSPPASRTDGYGIGHEYIPEGARLQLDPELDLDKLDLSPATRVIAKAMQEYGMYNGMNAPTFKIYFQNLGPEGGKWKNYHYFSDLKKIPINRFRVLKCNLVSKP